MDLKEVRYEAPLTQYLFHKASQSRIPLSGTFELSPVCNLACRMCYVRMTPQQVAAHGRPALPLARWLELAEQARSAGLLYLLLTGGEPFLWPDFWPLYERLTAMGFVLTVNTNGTLIDEAAIARLRARPPTRLNITLYGASNETYRSLCRADGMFTRVDRAIRGLREAGVLVKLNCSLTPHNAGDLEAMIRYARERSLILEVNTYMFPPMRRDPGQVGRNDRFTPEEAARRHMERYRLQYGEETYVQYLQNVLRGIADPPGLDESCVDPVDGRIRCRAGKAAFWVTWDGWLTPCGMMTEPRVDLADGSFDQAWQTLTERSAQLRLSGVCGQCPDRDLCHSCAAMAQAETGSPGGIPRYLCRMVEAMKTLARQELDRRGP
ncbi:radical SAM protein [uncultured Oscillibacter sp.]|uniref:radical SAM protein n=1 Tax=uncultured Oscillibacter sp. TaxID=876091 RepID=UPI0025EF08CB|nr:radical SAM protein [uncultured Oscillibacter sp.]